MNPSDDIHDYAARLRRCIKRIDKSSFDDRNKKTVLNFIDKLKIYDVGFKTDKLCTVLL